MQGQESGQPCELKLGNKRGFFFPLLSFSGIVVTQISCPCCSLPDDRIISPRDVLTQHEGGAAEGSKWGGPEHSPSMQLAPPALGWPEIHTAFASFSLSISVPGLSGHPSGIMFSLMTLTLLSSSADAHTLTERVCHEIPPASESSVGDNYPYASLCWVRVNNSVDSFLLALLFAPWLFISL